MNKRTIFYFAVALILCTQNAVSQINTNSPYTRFGFGEFSKGAPNELKAMGNVAFANRSKNTINAINPASYSSVDSLTFMLDMAGSGLISRFSDKNTHNNSFTANLDYLTLRFPLAKWLGMSVGMLPYSYTGYNFNSSDTLLLPNETVDNTKIPFIRSFNGNGGLSQVYGGFSANLFNHISIGLNTYYLFGEMSNSRSLLFPVQSISSTTVINRIKVSDIRLRYGMQIYNTFAKKHDVTIGAIFEQKQKLNGTYTSQLRSDTLTFNNGFELPMTLGVGANYTFDKKLTVGVDFQQENWGEVLYFNTKDSLNNRTSIGFGAEYANDPSGRRYSDRIKYRVGFNTSNQYYKVNNQIQPNDYTISFGIGLPTRTGRTWMNATLEYGRRGSISSLREDFFRVSFSASINENWFFKPKL
jgi:hypothetical protein